MKYLHFSLFLSVMLLVCSVETFATDIPTLTVDTVSGTPGTSISVPIVIEHNPGLSSLKLYIDYDQEQLTLEHVDYNSNFCEASQEYTATNIKSGILNWIRATGENHEQGEFAVLHFRIAKNASAERIPIFLHYDVESTFDQDLNPVIIQINNGYVQIKRNPLNVEQTLFKNSLILEVSSPDSNPDPREKYLIAAIYENGRFIGATFKKTTFSKIQNSKERFIFREIHSHVQWKVFLLDSFTICPDIPSLDGTIL